MAVTPAAAKISSPGTAGARTAESADGRSRACTVKHPAKRSRAVSSGSRPPRRRERMPTSASGAATPKGKASPSSHINTDSRLELRLPK